MISQLSVYSNTNKYNSKIFLVVLVVVHRFSVGGCAPQGFVSRSTKYTDCNNNLDSIKQNNVQIPTVRIAQPLAFAQGHEHGDIGDKAKGGRYELHKILRNNAEISSGKENEEEEDQLFPYDLRTTSGKVYMVPDAESESIVLEVARRKRKVFVNDEEAHPITTKQTLIPAAAAPNSELIQPDLASSSSRGKVRGRCALSTISDARIALNLYFEWLLGQQEFDLNPSLSRCISSSKNLFFEFFHVSLKCNINYNN